MKRDFLSGDKAEGIEGRSLHFIIKGQSSSSMKGDKAKRLPVNSGNPLHLVKENQNTLMCQHCSASPSGTRVRGPAPPGTWLKGRADYVHVASLSSLDGVPRPFSVWKTEWLLPEQHEGQSSPWACPLTYGLSGSLQLAVWSRSRARCPGRTLSTSGSLWVYHGHLWGAEPEEPQHGQRPHRRKSFLSPDPQLGPGSAPCG